MRAASLAAEIESKAGMDATITPGGKGQFDVVVDGDLVFSKHESGRFPEDDEVVSKLVAQAAE